MFLFLHDSNIKYDRHLHKIKYHFHAYPNFFLFTITVKCYIYIISGSSALLYNPLFFSKVTTIYFFNCYKLYKIQLCKEKKLYFISSTPISFFKLLTRVFLSIKKVKKNKKKIFSIYKKKKNFFSDFL